MESQFIASYLVIYFFLLLHQKLFCTSSSFIIYHMVDHHIFTLRLAGEPLSHHQTFFFSRHKH